MSENSYVRQGKGGRATRRVALLIPHTDTTLETDLQRELPRGISLHTQRMWLAGISIEEEKTMLKKEVPKAIKYLVHTRPDVAVLGCTSASALNGVEAAVRLSNVISIQLNCEAISAFGAILSRLNVLKIKRCAVFTPYCDKVTARIVSAIEEKEFHVEFSAGMRKTNDVEVGLIQPQEIIEFIGLHDKKIKQCDCIVISCTNLRSFECAAAIESKYSVPVITSNQSIFFYLVNLFGYRPKRKLSSVSQPVYHLH